MSKSYTDPFTRADGALGSVPSGPAYSVLSGSFAIATNKATSSTAPGSNPLVVVPVGLRANGKVDSYAEINPSHVYGNAVFVRVSDVSNWVRARLRSYTSTYYTTEYQHTSYITEYEYSNLVWLDNYTARTVEYEVKYLASCTFNGWTTFGNVGSPTACRSSAPATPADVYDSLCTAQAIGQYRWVDLGGTGCTTPNHKFQEQYRSQTVTPNWAYKWVPSNYSLGANESFTGANRYVNGSNYGLINNSTSTTNPGKQTTPNSPADLYLSTGTTLFGTYWSSTGPQATGPQTDPATGASRQTANGTYWDTTYEAGAPTRQAGPYTSYYYGSIVLEKCVAGSISSLGSYDYGSATPYLMRLSTVGSQLTVTYNGSVLISVSDAFNNVAGVNVGFGGGTSEYNATLPNLDDFKFGGISPERVLVGGVWQTANRKILVGGVWVDYDTRPK